ncbi:MAG TPA: tetratricopeptide repeat protein [Methylomirabilota bacterium]|nr:tetratricopeptide repeat protein [Methylomirabilota bacterium]
MRLLEKYSGKLLILSVVAWVFVTFASHPAIANPEGPVVASEDAEQSLKAGRQALEQNALREALQHFRKAVAALPTSVPAQAYRGSVAEMLGEFDEALEAYTEAARLEPSVTHSYLLGSLAERMGKTALAVQWLKASLAGSTGEGMAEYLFRVLVESRDREAVLNFARSRGWVREGADYCGLPVTGVTRETLALLAMLIHPERADCLISVGVAITDGGSARLARFIWQIVIRNTPDAVARQQVERYLRVRLPAHDVSKLAESLNVVGHRLYNRSKKPIEAIEAYKKAIADDPNFSWPYPNIGVIYYERGQLGEALMWLRQAVVVNPDHWRAQVSLGVVTGRLKRYDEALVAFRRAVALNPEDAYSQAQLGRLLLHFGREDEGVQALQAAVRLNRDLAQERELLERKLGERMALVEEALQLSGAKKAIFQVQSQLQVQLRRSPLAAGPGGQAVIEIFVRHFQSDELYAVITKSLLDNFYHERMLVLLPWLRSPLSKKFTQLEAEADAPGNEKDLEAFAQRLNDSGLAQERLALVRRLDEAVGLTDSVLDGATIAIQGMTKLNPEITSPRHLEQAELEKELQAAYPAVQQALLTTVLYAYRSVSDQELTQYVEFWESETGRWFNRVFRKALLHALKNATDEAADQIAKSGRLPKPKRDEL